MSSTNGNEFVNSRKLVDAYLRSAYPAHTEVSSHNWIVQAENYLANADYYAAAQLAREATIKQSDSAESWFILSRAKAGLRELNDAVYEAKRAIELAPMNAMYYYNLGTIYEELGLWKEAFGMYEQAAQREPTEPHYQLAMGGVKLQTNHPAEAESIIKRVYSALPDNEDACNYYAHALIAMAEAVPKDKDSEGFAVTKAEEIQQMRTYLNRAFGIRHLDQETKRAIRDMEAYLQSMESRTFHIPLQALSFGFAMASDGSCAGILIGILGMTALFGAPLLVLMWSFASFSSGAILGGLFLLLCSIGLGYLWYKNVWVPRWKVNARLRDHRIRYLN